MPELPSFPASAEKAQAGEPANGLAGSALDAPHPSSPWALHALALVLIILLAGSIRFADLPSVSDGLPLDGDSCRFLRIAEADVSGHPIGARDMMRWLPEGRDMTTYLPLHSVVMSRLYLLLRRLGYRLSFPAFAVRYPVACYALSILVAYLLAARYLSSVAGLAAAALMAVVPATVFRSSAGFVDRDPFCLLLVFCAYAGYAGVLAEDTERGCVFASLVCGAFGAVLGLAWEGAGLFTVAFACNLVWLGMTGRLTRTLILTHCMVAVMAVAPLLILTRTYRDPWLPYSALALFPLPTVCAAALLSSAVARIRVAPGLARPSAPAHVPAWSFFCGGIIVAVLALTIVATQAPRGTLVQFLSNARHTLGDSRLMRSVSELQPTYLRDWVDNYGLAGIFVAIGLGLAASRLVPGAAGARRAFVHLTIMCATLIVASTSISRLIPAGGSTTGGLIRLVAIGVWFGGATLLGRAVPADPEDAPRRVLFFLLVWWFILAVAAAGAIRHQFLLAAPACMLAGFAACRWFTARAPRRQHAEELEGVLFVLVVLWALAPIGLGPVRLFLHRSIMAPVEYAVLGAGSAAALGYVFQREFGWTGWWRAARTTAAFALAAAFLAPTSASVRKSAAGLQPACLPLLGSLRRLRHSLPRRAVVLAWWDYGSYINMFAHRATFIDEDHFRPARIADVARRVYCATDAGSAAGFLAGEGVTDWMITNTDMEILPEIAWIGGLTKTPGAVKVFPFDSPSGAGRSSSDWVALRPVSGPGPPPWYARPLGPADGPTPPFRIHDSEVIGSSSKPYGCMSVSGIRLRRSHGGGAAGDDGIDLSSVQVRVWGGEAGRWVSPGAVTFDGLIVRPLKPGLAGAVVIEPGSEGSDLRGLYIPSTFCRLLSVRLFILGDHVPGFRALPWTGPRVRVWEVVRPRGGPVVRTVSSGRGLAG